MAQPILVTGFDPFGGEDINPAWEAVSLLPDEIGSLRVARLQVPTVFGKATQAVLEKAAILRPRMILCVGQAGGRSQITPEMVGINLRWASIPDNGGNMPQDVPIVPDGPAAYFSTLPVRAMAQAIRDAHIPGAVSYSAGAFVCNDLLYSLLHHFAGSPVGVGFIHVPYLPQQAREGMASLPLDQMVQGLTAAIRAADNMERVISDMKILSIGNSFSQDAQHYLHQMAALEGEELTCVNLYIGGCSLETHWNNWEGDLPLYTYEVNGDPVVLDDQEHTVRHCSIREALMEGGWDVITFQQCSHFSGEYESYQPYLSRLSQAVRALAPNAAQWIHQTWAYEKDSAHGQFPRYNCDQSLMYTRLTDAYRQASQAIRAPLIPSGQVIQALRGLPEFDYPTGLSLCRDGFHMSIPLGRYALAVTWFTALLGRAPRQDYAAPESKEDDAPLRALIRKTAEQVVLHTDR